MKPIDLVKKLTDTAEQQANPKLESCSWGKVRQLIIDKRVEILDGESVPCLLFVDGRKAVFDDGRRAVKMSDEVVQAIVSDDGLRQTVMRELDPEGEVLFWEGQVPVLKYSYKPEPFTRELQALDGGKWHRGASIQDGLPGLPRGKS